MMCALVYNIPVLWAAHGEEIIYPSDLFMRRS